MRKTGIMGIVLSGGRVNVDDGIRAEIPPGPQRGLKIV